MPKRVQFNREREGYNGQQMDEDGGWMLTQRGIGVGDVQFLGSWLCSPTLLASRRSFVAVGSP